MPGGWCQAVPTLRAAKTCSGVLISPDRCCQTSEAADLPASGRKLEYLSCECKCTTRRPAAAMGTPITGRWSLTGQNGTHAHTRARCASNFAADSSCISGGTCVYVSIVSVIDACPNISCTIFG